MTDHVQIAIISAVTTAAPLMLLYWLNHRAVMSKVTEVKEEVLGKVGSVETKVQTIEKQTNSMKDALVLAAREAGGSEARERQTDIDKAVAAATSVPVVPAQSTLPAPTTGRSKVKLDTAIEQLTDAAQETVEAAEKTVEHADKIPRKP